MKILHFKLLPTNKARRLLALLWISLSLLFTLFSGALLFRESIIGGLTSAIINIGLDPMRTQLIAALIMTAGAALIGAFVGRSKTGSILGASGVFWFGYLNDFIQGEIKPLTDPGGRLEPLNQGALVNTSLTMLALALLSAFIGAAVGVALGQVLLNPLLQLLQLGWRTLARWQLTRTLTSPMMASQRGDAQPARADTVGKTVAAWIGAIGMIVLLVFASKSGDFFIFSPDVGLHQLPQVAGRQGQPAQGTLVQGSLVSQALRGQRKPFTIYLPPSYNTPESKDKRYPVLYLLHGSPGTNEDWIKGGKATESADTLIATGEIPELIIVFPDGNGRRGKTSEWGNSGDGTQLIETYIVKDLVTYIDQHYRTIPDGMHRAIGGLSMGGFGAANIATHYPNMFGTAISLGGYYYAEGSIWGPNRAYQQKNSPAITIKKSQEARKVRFYLGAATRDQPYYDRTRQFMRELNQLRVPFHFDLQSGYHSWRVWQVQMYNALLWLKWDSNARTFNDR